MAFTASNLHLRAGAVGDLAYSYDAGDDTMATVAASGYFNNSDDGLNLAAEDLIWCQCADGNMWLRVSAVASGVVTTQFAGGNLPVQTAAYTSTAAAVLTLGIGHYEYGTSINTATRVVLPVVYPGAEVIARRIDSGTQAITFDAGGSGATGVVYDATLNRRITSRHEGDAFHVVGSSTARWRIYSTQFGSSGSEDLGGGASAFLGAT